MYTINIPTAEQARKQVNIAADEKMGQVWNSILYSVQCAINNAIAQCKYEAYVPRAGLHGVDAATVMIKLQPMLNDLGYTSYISEWQEGININWLHETKG